MNFFKKEFALSVSVLLFLLLLVPSLTSAQNESSYTDQTFAVSLKVNMSPEKPKPGQEVSVKIEGYAPLDLNSSTVSFFLDGKLISKGIGLRDIKFIAPTAGKTSEFRISILTEDGKSIVRTISISPASVDLNWYSDSYVPPFYRGVPLYTYQGKVTVVAIPTFTKAGVAVQPENLIYTWKRNSEIQGSASGRGRQSFTFDGGLVGREVMIEVEVSTADGSISGSATLSFEPVPQQLVLYKKDPLFGVMWNRAIPNTLDLNGKEAEIQADPYYFDMADMQANKLKYSWKIGFNEFPDLATNNRVLIKPKDNSSGISTINLTINNLNHILQKASAGISLNFNQ